MGSSLCFSTVCKGDYTQALRLLWGGKVQNWVSLPSAQLLSVRHPCGMVPWCCFSQGFTHTQLGTYAPRQRRGWRSRGMEEEGSWRSFPVWKIVIKLKNGKLKSPTGKALGGYQKRRLSSFSGSCEI